jgi:hypothetical protein
VPTADLGRRIENKPTGPDTDAGSSSVSGSGSGGGMEEAPVGETIEEGGGVGQGAGLQEEEENMEQGEVEEGDQPHHKKRRRNAYEVKSYPPRMWRVARPSPTMKGHTAFLTFAVAPASCGEQAATTATASVAVSSSTLTQDGEQQHQQQA